MARAREGVVPTPGITAIAVPRARAAAGDARGTGYPGQANGWVMPGVRSDLAAISSCSSPASTSTVAAWDPVQTTQHAHDASQLISEVDTSDTNGGW